MFRLICLGFTPKIFLPDYFIVSEIQCMTSDSARDLHRYCSNSIKEPTKIPQNFLKIFIRGEVFI